MTESIDPADLLLTSFLNKVNADGYGFQFAVVKAAERLFDENKSPWRFPVTEFPVEVRGCQTRIDIIFRHRRPGLWLICECKRANPALRDWCFLKAPYTNRGTLAGQVYADCLVWSGSGPAPSVQVSRLHSSDRIYHLAAEIKGKEKGESSGSGRGAIEEAVAQALRGQNGLVQFLSSHERANSLGVVKLLPVVITTANLWASNADIANADLATGKLDKAGEQLNPIDWLWYHYPQSPGLKHTLTTSPSEGDDDVLIEALYSEFVRPVAVVSASGLPAFLGMGHFNV